MIDDFINYNIKEKNEKFLKVLFIVVCAISIIISINMFIKKADNPYISETLYPVDATEYIKNNLDYKNIRIYNGYDYGSYLLMEGVPVFIDSRCDLYTPEFNKDVNVFNDYMDTANGKTSISSLMDKYDLEYAIVPVGQFEDTYISENEKYIELYKDEYFVVYQYIK